VPIFRPKMLFATEPDKTEGNSWEWVVEQLDGSEARCLVQEEHSAVENLGKIMRCGLFVDPMFMWCGSTEEERQAAAPDGDSQSYALSKQDILKKVLDEMSEKLQLMACEKKLVRPNHGTISGIFSKPHTPDASSNLSSCRKLK
jgi:hypothetical protein